MLKGIFKDYTIPGLALGIIVGGSALFAAILSIRKSRFAVPTSIAAGLVIMFFEFIEMLVIGSLQGPARFVLVFYFVIGTVIIAVPLAQWFLSLVTEKS